ncbi:MAG: hypothetical protein AB9835_00935 [Eubacteriales bacterium]
MKKFICVALCLFVLMILSSCIIMKINDKTETYIISDTNNRYEVYVMDDKYGSFYIGNVNLREATLAELKTINSDVLYDGGNLTITDAINAAQTGASILDNIYDNWSEAKSIAVYLNTNANTWIIHGQITDRTVKDADVGIIAIAADIGEVLFILYSKSNT